MPGLKDHEDVSGYEAFHWPETQALLRRLGFDLDSPTTSVTISFPVDGMCRVVHEFNGLDMNNPKKPVVVDSTNQHNETYRTKKFSYQV